jgi:hypothetical protein
VDLAQFGAKGRREALKEVAFLNAMHHPCIVGYREFFEHDNGVRQRTAATTRGDNHRNKQASKRGNPPEQQPLSTFRYNQRHRI